MKAIVVILSFCAVLGWSAGAAVAQSPSPSAAPSASPSAVPSASPSAAAAQAAAVEIARTRLDAMLKTGHADPAWFSAAFLAQIPASKIDEILATLKDTLGEYRSIEFTSTRFVAHFAKGTDDVLVRIDADGKIAGILFRPPVLAAAGFDERLKLLQPPHGTVAYVITEEAPCGSCGASLRRSNGAVLRESARL